MFVLWYTFFVRIEHSSHFAAVLCVPTINVKLGGLCNMRHTQWLPRYIHQLAVSRNRKSVLSPDVCQGDLQLLTVSANGILDVLCR